MGATPDSASRQAITPETVHAIQESLDGLQSALQALQALAADEDALLTERDVAALFRLEVRTVAKWRERSDGPPFVKYGKSVRYQRRALRQWMERNTFRSTAEAQG